MIYWEGEKRCEWWNKAAANDAGGTGRLGVSVGTLRPDGASVREGARSPAIDPDALETKAT